MWPTNSQAIDTKTIIHRLTDLRLVPTPTVNGVIFDTVVVPTMAFVRAAMLQADNL